MDPLSAVILGAFGLMAVVAIGVFVVIVKLAQIEGDRTEARVREGRPEL